MKKKGFTLVELLGVISILAVIAAIALPSVTGVIKRNKEKQYNIQIDNIKELANNYITENMIKLGEFYHINLTLYQIGVDTGSDILIKNPKTDKYFPLDTTITVDCSVGVCETTVKEGTDAYIYTDETYGSLKLSDFYVNEIGNVADYATTNSGNLTYNESNDSVYYVLTDSTGKKVSAYLNKATGIRKAILKNYPFLEVGDNGCKVSNANNYSYMGGCYLKGSQTKNYLWYSGFLWRVMGINNDGTVRLMTEENVTSISYNEEEDCTFENSDVDKWLNEYFLLNLKGTGIIVNSNFCQASPIEVQSSRTNCVGKVANRKVGLISTDEYILSGNVTSYLNNAQESYTLSPYNSSKLWNIFNNGDSYSTHVNNAEGVRPVININPNSIVFNGDGTLNNTWVNDISPYVLNDTKSVTGLLKDKSISGEYVKFVNKLYRVVSKDNDGNVKLIYDGYYDGASNQVNFGSNNIFSVTSGLGKILNEEVLNWIVPSNDTKNKDKLFTNYKWYQSMLPYAKPYTYSLNETNPTRTIEATVGLIRVGEMLSGQSYTMFTQNGTVASNHADTKNYWTLTPTANDSMIWNISYVGNAVDEFTDSLYGEAVRPVIVIKANTAIIGGNGTPASPYEI